MSATGSPRMLLSADWVVPVSREPIRDGAVLVSGDRIAAVGARRDLVEAFPSEQREHFPGSIITPGLVNAHTHLTLTAMSGVVPSLPFAEWLPRLVKALGPWEIADHEASGVVGAEECLLCGVTVVGDIAYGAAEVTSAGGAGLGGVFYWELLGMDPEDVADHLEYLKYPHEPAAYGPRVACGLSPHSPYTAGPKLLQAVHARAESLGVPTAIHVAESLAEVELLATGTGPLAATAGRAARGFTPPGLTTVAYLDSLGVLEGTTAVHVCYATDEDIALMARRVRGVVTCPRSNRYLHNPLPSVRRLLDAGIAVGVGTDSSASNADLDLVAELRAIREAEPAISCTEVLEMATLGGASAIGVDDGFGSLEVGKYADVTVFRVATSGDPADDVVARGGRATVTHVMSGGEWRIGDGTLLNSDARAAQRAKRARERAKRALLEP